LPKDPCFTGGGAVGTASCGFSSVPLLQGYLAFTTHLAGINTDGSATDLGIGWAWTDTYNGGSSGNITTATDVDDSPVGGTGGVAIVGGSQTTSYQYPKSVGVLAINGNPVSSPTSASTVLLSGTQVSTTASGLAYSRVSQTFNGTVTIRNISSATINGPFQVVLAFLPTGTTVVNATSTFGGFPYVTIAGVGSLSPGQSASASVEFKNASNATINFSPIPYAGSFN